MSSAQLTVYQLDEIRLEQRRNAQAAARAEFGNIPMMNPRRLDFGQPDFDPNNQPDGQMEQLGNQVQYMNLNR